MLIKDVGLKIGILIVTVLGLSVSAQAKYKPIPLFETKEVLEVTFKSNFPELNRANANQEIVHPGVMTYVDGDNSVEMKVGLMARGGGRAGWCDFAPIRLVLPAKEKDEAGEVLFDPKEGTIFDNSKKKIRLITHCNPNRFAEPGMSVDNFVITEYLLYQLIESSGLPFLKTRLAHAKYLNNEGEQVSEGYLVFLENAGDLAQRYKGEKLEEGDPLELPNFSRVPFEMSLRLSMNEVDHTFNSYWNTFVVGQKEGEVANAMAGGPPMQVVYDLVYHPGYSPYGDIDGPAVRFKGPHLDWFKQFEANYPDLKDVLVKYTQTLIDNSADVLAVIETMPYPDPLNLEMQDRVRQWAAEFIKGGKDYLSGNKAVVDWRPPHEDI